MAALTSSEKALLGRSVRAFGRLDAATIKAKDKRVRAGESDRAFIADRIHDAISNGEPRHAYIELNAEEIRLLRLSGRFKEKCFLWILDDVSIKIIREKTPNVDRTHDRDHVCHSNLTGDGEAYAAGELFFGQDGNVYISPFSDRYGNYDLEQWRVAVQYFKSVGYGERIIDLWEIVRTS